MTARIGLAILGSIGWLGYRARQGRPAPPIQPGRRTGYARQGRRASGHPSRPPSSRGGEIHLHLNVTPDQLAAILRHNTEEE